MIEYKPRIKLPIIVALIIGGLFLGYLYVNSSGKKTSTIVLNMDIDDGIVFDVGDSLGPEERQQIKDLAIKKVIEDEEIINLLDDNEYSVVATIHGTHSIQDILKNSTLMRSETRVIFKEKIVVTVTLEFSDGSGYNVQVDISDWSLGNPVFSEEVVPPTMFREAIKNLNRTREIS